MARKASKSSALAKRPSLALDVETEEQQVDRVRELCIANSEPAVHSLLEMARAMRLQMIPNEDGLFEPLLDEDGEFMSLAVLPGPRTTACKAILEQAYGRPVQRSAPAGAGSGVQINVYLRTFGVNGDEEVIDVTPTPEDYGGEDSATEPLDS